MLTKYNPKTDITRFSAYRSMWLFVFFDLPTESKKDRKNYTKFRKGLLKDGFTMQQYSVYIRHCGSGENAEMHINRVKNCIPEKGNVIVLQVTDKQFGNMIQYFGKLSVGTHSDGFQLEIF